MRALLLRVGIDRAFGGWNAPVDSDGRSPGSFVYVPIPEQPGTAFHAGLERRYGELLPALHRLCAKRSLDLCGDLRFPQVLLYRAMHLDPDFECLTYGDRANTRGNPIRALSKGDMIVFYASLRPICDCEHKLIYALIGLFVVEECLLAANVPAHRRYENAHVRKLKHGAKDIVVRACAGESGRLERCIPIGEWRDGAYRVRQDLLKSWGGLSVKDGFIQRSAVPPAFIDPHRFRDWLSDQKVGLVQRNN